MPRTLSLSCALGDEISNGRTDGLPGLMHTLKVYKNDPKAEHPMD